MYEVVCPSSGMVLEVFSMAGHVLLTIHVGLVQDGLDHWWSQQLLEHLYWFLACQVTCGSRGHHISCIQWPHSLLDHRLHPFHVLHHHTDLISFLNHTFYALSHTLYFITYNIHCMIYYSDWIIEVVIATISIDLIHVAKQLQGV